MPGGALRAPPAVPPERSTKDERGREHTRALPQGGEQELWPGPGAQRRGLRRAARRGRGAGGRQRRRQVNAREDNRRDPSGRLRHDLIRGRDVTITNPTDAVALGIATVYQDLALCDNLDVVENLFLGREEIGNGPAEVLHQLDEVGMEKQTGELLENLAVTITDVRNEVGTMSGGQRQQVAIARSLLGEPKLVMLDEPTAALGVRQTAQVLALVKRLRERGFGVVVISHNLADVFEVADRIYVLRLGQEAGDFMAGDVSQDQVVGAITGASGNGGGQR